MKFSLLIIFFLFLSSSTPDHQNTPLKVDKHGKITGLPEKYHPAQFDFHERYLRIMDTELKFPACFEEYFINTDKAKINLSASWYHSIEVMPYYLNMEFVQENQEYIFSVLLNLETLELMEVRKIIRKETYGNYTEIELRKECLQEYRENIKEIN